jgi:hypothetical protein
MSIKLIGWSSAGGRGSWENIGAASVAESRGGGGVSSVIVTLHTMAKVGDITGGGAGGNAHLRRARPVGAGTDPDMKRAAAAAELAKRSPWVEELTAADHELGRAIMLLAGERNFVTVHRCRDPRGPGGRFFRPPPPGRFRIRAPLL